MAGWDSIAEQWLTLLGASLGPGYQLRNSDRFFILDPLAQREGENLIAFANDTLATLERTFAALNRPEIPGKRVVIAFANRRHYYSYIAHFDPEGEFATSGGRYMFAEYMYRHILSGPGTLGNHRGTVAHELTHHVLDHLALPLWLEEGLTQMMSERLTGERSFTLDRELAARHRSYWPRAGLQAFWEGHSYRDPEGQELSYNLSEVLVRRLAADYTGRFFDFVREAVWTDAGDASARANLGMDLGAIAASFLGPGDWQYRPQENGQVG